ncbi:hypothetical protein H2248_003993 [Termitomyces sp. 'cryptogamus']|nr:hypothetical protein H2248_003993 [Termitomyces sp. 'cryptogamus']
MRRSLSGFFFGAGGASASGSRSGSRSVAKGTDPPLSAAAALIEGTSKDDVREGGTGLEKRQSTWDARVSKALERAKASKVHAANGGVAMSPRAAWYVPQCDAKERERVLQRAHALWTSASGSRSGSGSDSTALTTPPTRPQQSSLVPAIVTAPPHVSLPPVSAPPADLSTATASTPTPTEIVPESRIVEVPPPETSSESSTSATDVTTTITEADASTDSRALFSTSQMLDSQPCPQSPPQSTSPDPTTSINSMESQIETPRPRPSPRKLPPPGPPPPGRTTNREKYQTAAAWSGSGSSDPDNNGDTHEPEGMRNIVLHDRTHRRYEGVGTMMGITVVVPHSAPRPSDDIIRTRTHHPQPTDVSFFIRSTVSSSKVHTTTICLIHLLCRRPTVFAKGSGIGGSLSGVHSPVHPDIDPEGTEVDRSPVATRIVSIVQDTMARLADVLCTSGSMRESGSRRMRERSSVASVSGSVSADAGTSRPGVHM